MSDFFDDLETRGQAEREAALMAALAKQVVHAHKNAPAYSELFADSEISAIDSRAALANLPLIRKEALIEQQRQQMIELNAQQAEFAILQSDWEQAQ